MFYLFQFLLARFPAGQRPVLHLFRNQIRKKTQGGIKVVWTFSGAQTVCDAVIKQFAVFSIYLIHTAESLCL